MCPNHVTFDLDLDLEHTWMQALLGTIMCKFGGDPAISVVEEAICAKCLQTDGQTDGRRTPHDCISSWNGLIKTELGVLTFYAPSPGKVCDYQHCWLKIVNFSYPTLT